MMAKDSQPVGNVTNWPVAIGAALLAGIVRLVPHPPNFTAVGALSLYAGARVPWYLSFGLPLSVMLATDVIIWQTQQWRPFSGLVYACYALSTALGLLARRSNSVWRIGGLALVGDIVFFLATNFGVWWAGYEQAFSRDLSGVLACYVAGEPFFRWTLISSALFVPMFFGAHALLTRTSTAPGEVKA